MRTVPQPSVASVENSKMTLWPKPSLIVKQSCVSSRSLPLTAAIVPVAAAFCTALHPDEHRPHESVLLSSQASNVVSRLPSPQTLPVRATGWHDALHTLQLAVPR